MEKTEVDLARLDPTELHRLAAEFGFGALDEEPQKLCGGYGSVNYSVSAEGAKRRALLRVSVGYPEGVARRQSAVLHAVAGMGVRCPSSVATPRGEYVQACKTDAGQSCFAIMLSWIEGQTANKFVSDSEAAMLGHLGMLLGSLHSAPQQPSAAEGLGLQDVSSDAYLACYMHWPDGFSPADGFEETKAFGHSEIAAFLEPRWKKCVDELSTEGLPGGLLHGDPFLDNVMVDPSAGAALLDWDDAAVGPFAWDLAVAVAGGCFGEGGALRHEGLRALLAAYCSRRRLTPGEVDALPRMIRANALIVAWYRWRAFHIEVSDAPASAKDSYKEMVSICLQVENASTLDALRLAVADANAERA